MARKLDAISKRVPLEAARALNEEHEIVMTQAKQLAPVDTGVMRASGTVDPPTITSRGIESKGSFGGASEKYVQRQHEDAALSHTVGQVKFYEQPFLERARQVGKNVVRALQRALK